MQCDTILYYRQSAIEEFMMTIYLNSIYCLTHQEMRIAFFFLTKGVCVLVCAHARAAGACMGIALSNG